MTKRKRSSKALTPLKDLHPNQRAFLADLGPFIYDHLSTSDDLSFLVHMQKKYLTLASRRAPNKVYQIEVTSSPQECHIINAMKMVELQVNDQQWQDVTKAVDYKSLRAARPLKKFNQKWCDNSPKLRDHSKEYRRRQRLKKLKEGKK